MYFEARFRQSNIEGDRMEKLAQTKDFCPNPACTDYGKLQSGQAQPNIKRLAKPSGACNDISVKPASRCSRSPPGRDSFASTPRRIPGSVGAFGRRQPDQHNHAGQRDQRGYDPVLVTRSGQACGRAAGALQYRLFVPPTHTCFIPVQIH